MSRIPSTIRRVADDTTGAGMRAGSPWQDGFGRFAVRCAQAIVIVIAIAVGVVGLARLSTVFIPVVLALIFASAMSPLTGWMKRRGVPPLVATVLALLAVVIVMGLVVWLIVWAVRDQWETLAESATSGFAQLQSLLDGLPFSVTQEQIDDAWTAITDFLTSSQFGSASLAGLSATANFATGLVLMVVLLFFFLKDGPLIWEFLLRPFTGDRYARARRAGDKTVSILGGYARGTTIVAAADAVGIGIGLLILQVPLAIPLAVIVFITAYIPIVGATVAGILAALVTLVTNGFVPALIVVAIVVVVNQLEGNFLQPVVMGRSLRLHPLVILLALTVGTIVGGIIGAVLAVPIAAVAWGIVSVWDGPGLPARLARPKSVERSQDAPEA